MHSVTTAITREVTHYISEHAVARFRERCEDALRPLTDRDLAIQLDERLTDAFKAGRVERVVDTDCPDEDTHVVKLETREVNRYLFVGDDDMRRAFGDQATVRIHNNGKCEVE